MIVTMMMAMITMIIMNIKIMIVIWQWLVSFLHGVKNLHLKNIKIKNKE